LKRLSLLACPKARFGATLRAFSLLCSVFCASADPCAATAHAQEALVTTPQTAPKEPSRFSLGAGLGVNLLGDTYGPAPSAASGLGGLSSAAARAPFGTSLFEFAASPKWRLVLGVAGSYNRRLSGDQDSGGADNAWFVSGSAGFRCVLNPGAVVELSPLVTVGGFRSQVEGVVVGSSIPAGAVLPVDTLRDSMALGYDVRAVLVLEHALLSNLYLRFETYLLRASYTKSALRDTPSPADDKCNCRRDFALAYGLSPVLQLRLTF
jgi:hypothetical protein